MRIATTWLLLLLVVPSVAHGWDRRWRHAESRVPSEPEFAFSRVTLFADLVLVSEPYLPSHCSEVRVYEGRVVAFDRATGATAWVRTVPMTTGDQSAYLSVYVAGDLVVFETWENMRAFDRRGQLAWSRDRPVQASACAGGPTHGPWGHVRRAGNFLLWSGENTDVCALNLRTGRVHERVRRSMPSSTYSVRAARSPCVPEREGAPHVVGSGCDASTLARAEVDASGRFWVRVRPR